MRIVYFLMKFINVLVSSAIIFPSFLLAQNFLTKKRALLVALLIAVIPSNFSFSPYILAENLFYFLFLISIYFLYKSFLDEGYKWDILSGIFIGLSMLAKSAGLILIFILIFTSFFYLLKYKQIGKTLFKKGILFLFLFLTYAPLLIRNFILFGFNFLSLGRDYYREATFLSGQLSLNFLNWIFIHLAYFILATGVILFIGSLFFYKEIFKNKQTFLFSILSISSLLFALYIVSNHNIPIHNPFFWLMGRPIGRYIEFVLPLFFISGFAGLQTYFKEKPSLKLPFVLVGLVLLSSFLIIFYPLFSPNNSSLVWMGSLYFILGNLFFKNFNFSLVFNYKFLFVYLILLILIFFLIYYLLKKSNIKSVFKLLFIFFLLTSLLCYGFIYYDTYSNWYKNGHNELGLWFNDNDKKVSNILFDERYSGNILDGRIINLNTGEEGIYERSIFELNNHSESFISIMGFWMNDNLYVGNINNTKHMDYIITMQKLDLNLVKKSKNGIFIYSVNGG